MGNIAEILNRVRDMLMLVIGSLALVMLTVGGVRYVIAGGDSKDVEAAKQTIKHALLGIGVAILAPVLIQLIKTILGQ
jgi:Type IV secretion system pilin